MHSNLKFIQLYRRQAKLVSEAAYYFTNLVSAKSFIINLNAKSLSIDEIEFEESMEAARLANKVSQIEPLSTLNETAVLRAETDPGPSTRMNDIEMNRSGELVNYRNVTFMNRLFVHFTLFPTWPTICLLHF